MQWRTVFVIAGITGSAVICITHYRGPKPAVPDPIAPFRRILTVTNLMCLAGISRANRRHGSTSVAWSKVSRHQRGYGSHWDKLRKAKLAAQPLCEYCLPKRVTAATEVDHRTPKAKGGTDDTENLASTCTPCHQAKSLRESAEAQGRTYRDRPRIGVDGWPVQE